MKSFEILEFKRVKNSCGIACNGDVLELRNGVYMFKDSACKSKYTLEECLNESPSVKSGHFIINKVRIYIYGMEYSIGDTFIDGQPIEKFTILENGSLQLDTKDEPVKSELRRRIDNSQAHANALAMFRAVQRQTFCHDWLNRSKEDDFLISVKLGMWPIEFLIPKREPLFKTTDGHKIFDGDEYFHITSTGDIQGEIAQEAGRPNYLVWLAKGRKTFKHDYTAKLWLKENSYLTYDGVLILDHNTLVYYVNEKNPYTVSAGDLYAKTKKGHWSKSIVFSTKEAAETYIADYKVKNAKLFNFYDIENLLKPFGAENRVQTALVEARVRFEKVL